MFEEAGRITSMKHVQSATHAVYTADQTVKSEARDEPLNVIAR